MGVKKWVCGIFGLTVVFVEISAAGISFEKKRFDQWVLGPDRIESAMLSRAQALKPLRCKMRQDRSFLAIG
jgi:hypothetical protein